MAFSPARLVYFPAQNSIFEEFVEPGLGTRRSPAGATRRGFGARGLRRCLCGFRGADADKVVGDDTKPDPTVHAIVAAVSAAIEAVAALATLMRPSDPVRHR